MDFKTSDFRDCLKGSKISPGLHSLGERSFHSRGPAAEKLPCQSLLCVESCLLTNWMVTFTIFILLIKPLFSDWNNIMCQWYDYQAEQLLLVVLDRVRHFRPIPIHRFFAVNRIRYRYDTDFLIRFKSGRGAAWLTDQRLQMPPPQLITAVRRGPVAARRRMPLICRGQSNTATISKV